MQCLVYCVCVLPLFPPFWCVVLVGLDNVYLGSSYSSTYLVSSVLLWYEVCRSGSFVFFLGYFGRMLVWRASDVAGGVSLARRGFIVAWMRGTGDRGRFKKKMER